MSRSEVNEFWIGNSELSHKMETKTKTEHNRAQKGMCVCVVGVMEEEASTLFNHFDTLHHKNTLCEMGGERRRHQTAPPPKRTETESDKLLQIESCHQ